MKRPHHKSGWKLLHNSGLILLFHAVSSSCDQRVRIFHQNPIFFVPSIFKEIWKAMESERGKPYCFHNANTQNWIFIMMSRKRFVASPPNIYSRHDSLSSWLLQRLEKVNNKLFCNNTTSFVFCCVSYYSCKLCRCTSKSLRSYLTLKISCFYCCRETEEAKKFVVEAKTIGDKESNNKGKH